MSQTLLSVLRYLERGILHFQERERLQRALNEEIVRVENLERECAEAVRAWKNRALSSERTAREALSDAASLRDTCATMRDELLGVTQRIREAQEEGARWALDACDKAPNCLSTWTDRDAAVSRICAERRAKASTAEPLTCRLGHVQPPGADISEGCQAHTGPFVCGAPMRAHGGE